MTVRTARTAGDAVAPGRAVHLHSRAHIDLQRVAASLCRS
ncbi:putative leader peptide [Streptomyces sp. NPDC059443]